MRVSILVPVYGVEKFIGRCARSLFGQTFDDIEYVFVDDGSPDDSIVMLGRILEEFPRRKPHVKIVRHEHNKGSAGARNTALDHATGKYVMYVDSDDYLEPDAVRLLHDKAEEERADVVVYDMRYDYGDKIFDSIEVIPADRHDYVKELLLRNHILGVCGKMFDRDLFGSGIRFVEGINYGEDYTATSLLSYKARKIVKLDKVLYSYVQTNAGALTKVHSPERERRNMRDIERAVKTLCDFFSQVPEKEIYAGICDRIKVANKILLLKVSGTKVRRRAASLYPEAKSAERSLGLIDKTLLLLARLRLWALLDACVRLGVAVKYMLK
jgi:glycosyltransferase involved in cell wall biosynthesis